jgi:hypothetical protein
MEDICRSCRYESFGGWEDIAAVLCERDSAAPNRDETALKVKGELNGAKKSVLAGTSGSSKSPETAIRASDSKLRTSGGAPVRLIASQTHVNTMKRKKRAKSSQDPNAPVGYGSSENRLEDDWIVSTRVLAIIKRRMIGSVHLRMYM